jgi:hypothetical protein
MRVCGNPLRWFGGILLAMISSVRSLADGFRIGLAEFQKAGTELAQQIGRDDDDYGPRAA